MAVERPSFVGLVPRSAAWLFRPRIYRENGAWECAIVPTGQCRCDDDWCEILGRSFREDTIPEWVIGADGQPCCTQFVPMGDKLPTPRCEHTDDMFGGGEQSAA